MSLTTKPKPFQSCAQTSHPLPKLPLELRTQIWHAAAQQPRTLDLWRLPLGVFYFHNSSPRLATSSVQTYRFCTSRPVPAILHINRESRAIGLEHYTLAFGCVNHIDDDYGITMDTPPRTYISWKLDTILLLGERDDNLIPDALAGVVPAEGASIALEVTKVQYDNEWNEFTAIAANSISVQEVVFYSDAMVGNVQLNLKQFRKGTVELVGLEEGEEQRPESMLIKGRDALELQFQQLSTARGKRRWGV